MLVNVSNSFFLHVQYKKLISGFILTYPHAYINFARMCNCIITCYDLQLSCVMVTHGHSYLNCVSLGAVSQLVYSDEDPS